MDGKEMMKDLYKYFGEKKEEDQEMHSIANVLYEMGTKEEKEPLKSQFHIQEAMK